jgi:hypothetical protein
MTPVLPILVSGGKYLAASYFFESEEYQDYTLGPTMYIRRVLGLGNHCGSTVFQLPWREIMVPILPSVSGVIPSLAPRISQTDRVGSD